MSCGSEFKIGPDPTLENKLELDPTHKKPRIRIRSEKSGFGFNTQGKPDSDPIRKKLDPDPTLKKNWTTSYLIFL